MDFLDSLPTDQDDPWLPPELLALIEEYDERQNHAFATFDPNPKQRLLTKLTQSCRELLFVAANQSGKCTTFSQVIDTGEGLVPIGELYERQQPFTVRHPGAPEPIRVTEVFKLPPEPCVRLRLSNGRTLECALRHRILCHDGQWRHVQALLPSGRNLSPSSWGRSLLARDVNGPRCPQTVAGFLLRCFHGFHQYDAPLLARPEVGPVSPPLPGDARAHVRIYGRTGVLVARWLRSRLGRYGDRLSSSGGLRRLWVQSVGFLSQCGYRFVQPRTYSCPGGHRPEYGSTVQSRSRGPTDVPVLHDDPDGYTFFGLKKQSKGIRIVAYHAIPRQDVYDFTVPEYHAYVTAGVVNHNSHVGGYIAACHLTGIYPDWWQGRRLSYPKDRQLLIWASGVTSDSTRDTVQTKLLGPAGEFGTGFLPPHAILDMQKARGVANLMDYILVQHYDPYTNQPDGVSRLRFMFAEKGREKWQGPSVDFVWMDEEHPADVYEEALARTIATGGAILTTFTPLKGMSSVVLRFLQQDQQALTAAKRAYVQATIDDATHIPESEKETIVNSFLPHEREARARGVPTLGSGAIYPVSRSHVEFNYHATFPHGVPPHYHQLVAIDFGWDHPFAAVKLAYDPEADRIYALDIYKKAQAPIIEHAAFLRVWTHNGDIPIAYPSDGLAHDRGGGEPLARQLEQSGLWLLEEPAHLPEAYATGHQGSKFSVEGGISLTLERMRTNRLLIADHLKPLWDELSTYHRKEGRVHKLFDDALDALRYGTISIEYAAPAGTRDEWRQPLDYTNANAAVI